jgi:hypothetical protein
LQQIKERKIFVGVGTHIAAHWAFDEVIWLGDGEQACLAICVSTL